ncbi:hypothetical protein HYT57_03640 [Candidatus Woesearchaeota archaeon]|nr:hypothetical protein [Candidatus Woesearchaeota archaeon]
MKKRSSNKKEISSKHKKDIPLSVKVISVYYFIIAFFSVLAGVYILIFKDFSRIILEGYGLSITSSGMLSGIGILVAALGVFYIFIGKDLWRVRNWARVVAIIVSSLSILDSLVNLLYGEFSVIFFLLIDGLIIWYLAFNKDAKKAFS